MTLTNQANYIIETTLRVRYQETDQMGVVYHANYLVWFEVGRSDFIRKQGYSYQLFEEQGLLLPVVEINCKYIAPARYDEEIAVLTQLAEVTGSKMVFAYEVVRESDRKLLVKGTSKHLWVNKEMKRVNLKRLFPEVFDRLTAICAKKEDETQCSG